MYDGGKIIVGLIIGIGLLLFPFYYDGGRASRAPERELTAKAKESGACIEPKSYMTTEHMKVLDQWRNEVVRNNQRIYTSSSGKTYEMSLENTCMNCHSNKSKFCDQCHNYMTVAPFCWNCHIAPEEGEQPRETTARLLIDRVKKDIDHTGNIRRVMDGPQ